LLFHAGNIIRYVTNTMDALTPEQQAEIKKLSSERIRAKLVKAGYDEDTVFAFDRQQLLDTFAAFTLKPVETTASDAELRGREIDEDNRSSN